MVCGIAHDMHQRLRQRSRTLNFHLFGNGWMCYNGVRFCNISKIWNDKVETMKRILLKLSAAGKGSQNLCLHSHRTENFRYVNAVHDRRQHTYLVCLGPVDMLTGTSAPEIASSDDNSHLRGRRGHGGDDGSSRRLNFHLFGNGWMCYNGVSTPLTVSSSNPVFFSPASASPLSFSNILFIVSTLSKCFPKIRPISILSRAKWYFLREARGIPIFLRTRAWYCGILPTC